MAKQLFLAWDAPEGRDYQFNDYEEYARSENEIEKRPKNKLIVQNQKGTPACTCYGLTHIVNANNIIEDKKLGLSRPQIDPLPLRNKFCSERGDYSSGTAIQTMANWMKKQGLIEGYVTISNTQPIEAIERQVDQSLAMGKFIYTGSMRGDWAAIKKTGIYQDRTDGVINGHIWDIVIEKKEDDYYWCLNSYGDKRGPFGGYFKLHKSYLNKIFSKLVIIDKDDSHMFDKFEEIQKIKQAIELLRKVYHQTTLDGVKQYLEQVKLGETLSKLYGVVI